MRMWGVDPRLLCRQHLLGEHVEMHMFVGTILKGVSLTGYVSTGLVHVPSIRRRHQALVAEMKARGMNHHSPLPRFSFKSLEEGTIDVRGNLAELRRRCPACKKLITNHRS